MSGIAGVLLPPGKGGLRSDDMGPMGEGLAPGGPVRALILGQGRLGLCVSDSPGYDTWLVSRRTGDVDAALALHGRITNARAFHQGDDPARLGDALLQRFLDDGPEKTALALRGDFAFAFWDGRGNCLTVGVDRVRIQSLVVAGHPDGFLFGSRMGALLRAPTGFTPTIHPASVLDIVGASVVSTPRTIFREVEKVPPGHLITAQDGRVTTRAYWDVDYTNPSTDAVDALRRETRDALEGAIADHRNAEGGDRDSFGAFLSGGIDSSTVTGLLTRRDGAPVRTFSIGFGEERFNELSYARLVAEAFHTRHTEYFVTPEDTLQAMDTIAVAFDEPFANASSVPTYFCAKLARDHGVGVLYAGDGGDELFAGNERYATNKVFGRYDRLPAWFRNGLFTPAVRAAGTLFPAPILVKAKKYVTRASLPPAERMTSYGFWYIFPPAELVEPDFLASAGPYRPSAMSIHHFNNARAREILDRQLYLDLKVTISDNDILKVTRMCEAAGVAVRFPFLDERVVHAAERVPARIKMRGEELRTFFKETYADLLPPETRAKQKHGFGLPISLWLRDVPALRERMRDLVLGPASVARGYFRPAGLEELVRRHAADTTPFYGTILWNLMILELWHRRVLDGAGAARRS